MQKQLLSVFNSYAFRSTTQVFLAHLTCEELREILRAVGSEEVYAHLAHSIRATLCIAISHQIDRTFYFMHYESIPVEEFRRERCSLVASHSTPQTLQAILQNYNGLQQRIEHWDDYSDIQTAVFNPDLPLPPARRSTIAPRCETVYQIVLACEKLDQERNSEDFNPEEGEETQRIDCFYQLLGLQAEMANLELSAITDPIDHFSQLVFRFMVYRNSVLSLHSLTPFPKLSETMQRWKLTMSPHYKRASVTFAELAGFKLQGVASQYGFFTPDLLIDQGYLNEYIEALVDLSIDEDLVAFCGHSKQKFGEFYTHFESVLLNTFEEYGKVNKCSLQALDYYQKWRNYGLKPCTLLKLIESQANYSASQEIKQLYCLKQDSYIQNCARIHGFVDQSIQIIQCS